MKSIFKLNKLHLFLIVVFVLLASSLGFSMVEYFQSEMKQENEALKEGNNYDPFHNANYESIVGDLEDIIIPERRSRKHHHDANGNHHQKGESKKNCDNNRGNGGNRGNGDNGVNSGNEENDESESNFNPDPNKYILKSEIVPPVCPKCPESRSCPRQKPCPACPPCARCPEPSFTCKKVPNYSVSTVGTNNILPMPQLNSFAAFN